MVDILRSATPTPSDTRGMYGRPSKERIIIDRFMIMTALYNLFDTLPVGICWASVVATRLVEFSSTTTTTKYNNALFRISP
jgi:hypothetical protein